MFFRGGGCERGRREGGRRFLFLLSSLLILCFDSSQSPFTHSAQFQYSLADICFTSGCSAGGELQRARCPARGVAKSCEGRSSVDRRSRDRRSRASTAGCRHRRPGCCGEHCFAITVEEERSRVWRAALWKIEARARESLGGDVGEERKEERKKGKNEYD